MPYCFRIVCTAIFLLLLNACGGGGGGSSSTEPVPAPTPPAPTTAPEPEPTPEPPPPAGAPQPTSVKFVSDAGDFVGAGSQYRYSQANSLITLTADQASLVISIEGDEFWQGTLQLPNTHSKLTEGVYGNLTLHPIHDPMFGGVNWVGQGRSCRQLSGSINIRTVTYDNDELRTIDLEFEQYCQDSSSALRGEIHWDANDTTSPPGPAKNIPQDLWAPTPGTTPDAGSFIYLESQAGEFIGGGADYMYTGLDAVLSASSENSRFSITVEGSEDWTGDFKGLNTSPRIEVGYYNTLLRYPYHNPVKGGFNWAGNGRGCLALAGWFVVDAVTYTGSILTSIDLRFEQRCDGGNRALRGAIHWDANDPAMPPSPGIPPAGRWEPPSDVLPASGNYIYLESREGDFIGAGKTYLYTNLDAILSSSFAHRGVLVTVDGDEYWRGNFHGMLSQRRLEVGDYKDLPSYPFPDGGLQWSGEHRGCNMLNGWFTVDSVTYAGIEIEAIEFRFAQHCEGNPQPLHGAIRWAANDTTVPPGPAPIPDGLWEPPASKVPDTGNYTYLESQPGDFVGGGHFSYYQTNYLYTSQTAAFSVRTDQDHLSFNVNGDEDWRGAFQAMNSIEKLEVGYYSDLQRHPFNNPTKGGMDWGGEGRGCNILSGWFVVDSVTYDNDELVAFELRFEQHCENEGPALNGAIRWQVNDPTPLIGPTTAPTGLWEPAAGTTPASGNYVYLDSQPGDFIGFGNSYLYTDNDTFIKATFRDVELILEVEGQESWDGNFEGMNFLDRLEPGFYGNLQRHPFHNPVKGGLSWSGEARGCNTLSGWFMVDSVTYTGDELDSIELRFEQHCGRSSGLLNGKIKWNR